ncbi:hypothetical protein DFH27DRAFT_525521 [Peziza echinospora]|nr:hypothetical protein DFH27DRAFT_525521 [Peziza echinospora]
MPPQQQYAAPGQMSPYTNDASNFYQAYGQQQPAKAETPPTYNNNPPVQPATAPAQTDATRTASLLGLLKFTQAPSSATPQSVPIPREAVLSPPPQAQPDSRSFPASHPPAVNRPVNAQDLVASLLARSGTAPVAPSSSSDQHGSVSHDNSANSAPDSPVLTRSTTAPSAASNTVPVNPQDFILQFLRPKPQAEGQTTDPEPPMSEQAQIVEAVPSPLVSPRIDNQQNQLPKGDGAPSTVPENMGFVPPPASSPPQQASTQALGPNKSLFTYVNPFDQLQGLSPKTRTPKQQNSPGPNGVKKSLLAQGAINPMEIPLPFSPQPGKDASKIEIDEAEVLQQIDRQLRAQVEKAKEAEQKSEHESIQTTEQPYTEQGNDVNEPQSDESGNQSTKEENMESKESQEATTSSEVVDREDDEEADYVEHQGPVKVYNFPMKPFSAITINADIPNYQRPRFPVSKMADIARMPRHFDQLDRNLIAASSAYIVYAISKSGNRGGIRVLRQEDGKDRVLNKDTPDRTFNVVIGHGERVLGTSVSGAVLWADVGEGFEGGDWHNNSFMFPPSEEQGQTNGVLKSRARKSSRHIDVFAIGRGKTISIIHAPTAKAYAQGDKSNEVDSKKYLADHSRTIDTGKASKDFCFSEDDTVIISIDKAGKLKLWDVQDLVTFGGPYTTGQATATAQPPLVLSTPAMVLSAVSPNESYRATSVMFLDKHRPFHKGLALRYAIVGMKQNHTLQLWDLALQRPVQEIHFPQSSDTDALCSVAYHPPTGILVVGNPTRNSIYFIHLSAPKYNLPPQSQAQYVRNLAIKSTAIPKPDATAILSGLREYSFASKGQLMSLEILDTPPDVDEGEGAPLFELYVAHSKGMTSLNVFKEDLGWDNECKTKHSVDAIVAKVCSIAPMPQPPAPVPQPEPAAAASTTPTPDGLKPSPTPKDVPRRRSPSPAPTPASTATAPRSEKSDSALPVPTNGRKKKGGQRQQQQQPPQQPTDVVPDKPQPEKISQEKALQKSKSTVVVTNGPSTSTAVEPTPGNALTSAALEREVKKIEASLSTEFTRVFSGELDRLYKSLNEDRRVQQAAGDAKQEALLKLLSSTLTENVERVLADIVMSNIESQVIPAITNTTTQTIERKLADAIGRSLSQSVPAELRSILPDIVKRAVGHPDVLSKITDTVGKTLIAQLSTTVQSEFSRFLHASIFPAFSQLALETGQKVLNEVDLKSTASYSALERMHQQESRKVDLLIAAHQHDTRKVDQLMGMVQQLTELVGTMSRAQGDITRSQAEMSKSQLEMAKAQQEIIKQQTEFQEQVQKAQAEWMQGQSWAEEEESVQPETSVRPPTAPAPLTPEEIERNEIDALFRSGRFEPATVRWLQSKDRQEELFDEVVKNYRYDFMPSLSQLVLLSVSAAVTVNFENSVQDRINWLEGVFSVLNPRDPEISEICQRIMAVVVQRLEQSYMRIAERDPSEPALRKIPALAKKARELGNLNVRTH